MQHGQGIVECKGQGLAVTLLQIANAVARGAADVGHALRRDFHQVEPRRHADAHFAGKHRG